MGRGSAPNPRPPLTPVSVVSNAAPCLGIRWALQEGGGGARDAHLLVHNGNCTPGRAAVHFLDHPKAVSGSHHTRLQAVPTCVPAGCVEDEVGLCGPTEVTKISGVRSRFDYNGKAQCSAGGPAKGLFSKHVQPQHAAAPVFRSCT